MQEITEDEGEQKQRQQGVRFIFFGRGGKTKRLKITSADFLVPILSIIQRAVNFVTVNFVSADDTQLAIIPLREPREVAVAEEICQIRFCLMQR